MSSSFAESAPACWTLRPSDDGGWVPDWADSEPDPTPVPTIAWLTWHIGWWWTVAIDHVESRTPHDRADTHWPGSSAASIDWPRALRTTWTTVLDRLADADLDRTTF